MAEDLEKWVVAQQKAPAARGVAPAQAVRRPLQSSSSGGGLFKGFIIVILLAGAAITYLLLQEKKKDIETPPETVDVVTPPTQPNPSPFPEPPVEIEPEPIPDPAETARNEEPDLPPVVENEPEPEQVPDAELPPGDTELRAKAIGLILDARRKLDKELAANALAKEESIVQAHRSDLTRIRDAYVNRLEGAAAETLDEDLKRRLLAQAAQAKDLDAWIALLAPEATWIPKQSPGGGMVGKWINRSYNKESQWIAHPDGRVEIPGQKWQVTWEILEDGTLKVDWNKEKQYLYKRDGDGWTGKNPHGGVATLTPGELQ